MRILRTAGRLGIGTFFLFAALAESITTQKPVPAEAETAATPPKSVLKIVVVTVFGCLFVLVLGAAVLMASGLYHLAAYQPHIVPVRWMLQTGRNRSVAFHSRDIHVPDLGNPKLVKDGFVFYRKLCQPCHGAPGIAGEEIGRGINPKPPPLVMAGSHWTDAELFWIITHGLKLSGMPGFAPPLSNPDRWALVAFVRQIALLSPADYRLLVAPPTTPRRLPR